MPKSATIGAVVERLRSVDPDLTVSKVRYLESRGLIAPERSDRGTRRFDEEMGVSRVFCKPEDLERARAVVKAQV